MARINLPVRFRVVLAGLALVVVVLGISVNLTQAGDVFNQDPNFPECMDPEIDPFCPAGFPSDGGGGDGGGGGSVTCQYCKFGQDFLLSCATTPLYETGRTGCTASSDGMTCTLSGSYCTRI